MKRPPMRSDVEAEAINLLGSVPDQDLPTILAATSQSELEASIRAKAREENRSRSLNAIPFPPSTTSSEQRSAWFAAVEEAATSGSQTNIDTLLPSAIRPAEADALAAETELRDARDAVDHARGEKKLFTERGELRRLARQSIKNLQRELRRVRLSEAGLIALEILLSLAAAAGFFGVMDAPTLADVPGGTWLQVFGVALPSSVAVLSITLLLAKHARTWLVARLPTLIPLLVVALLCFTIAFGLLRAASIGSSDAGVAYDLGRIALFVLSMLASLIVAALIAALHAKASDLSEVLDSTTREERGEQETLVRLSREEDSARGAIAALDARVRAPEAIRVAFEQGVRTLARRAREDAAALDDRLARARSAFERIEPLSRAVRESLSSQLYELKRIEKKNGSATHHALLSFCFAFLLGAFAVSSTACTKPEPASQMIVCDGSGIAPQETCTTAFLVRSFESWIKRAMTRVGSRFVVITTAKNFAETRIAAAFEIPSFQGDVRRSKSAFVEAALARLKSLSIPADDPRDRRRRTSDLFSALAVAARVASETSGTRELVIASDGWFTSLGFVAEKKVPSVSEVEKALLHEGLSFDLSIFARVSVCGLHLQGADPKSIKERDALWREISMAHGSATPTLRLSCQGAIQ
ncbi:MAG: hypothetical protein HYV07_07610 [Deltaproteobacteria bacterium]|nr:hypothetical protein [Deltaproteobacteria bacterium]